VNIHEGHRERLRNRFVNEGGKNFAAHNLLELLLFYGIPRKDTNGIAHLLLQRFGDINGVLSASVDDLCLVPGVTKSAAVLIRLCSEMCGRLYSGDLADSKVFESLDDVGKYLVRLFYGLTDEYVYLVLLDTDGSLLKTIQVCKGGVNSVSLDMRTIVSACFNYNAAGIIIAHNHPGNCPYPSDEDLINTRKLVKLLSMNGLELTEHFVVSGGQYTGILAKALAHRALSAIEEIFEE